MRTVRTLRDALGSIALTVALNGAAVIAAALYLEMTL